MKTIFFLSAVMTAGLLLASCSNSEEVFNGKNTGEE